MQAFILGLSTGAVCLAYCAPALLPYLFIQGEKTCKNFVYLGLFLAGRLLGYILFAVIAWSISKTFLYNNKYRELIYGSAFLVLSALLLFYGLGKINTTCGCHSMKYRKIKMLQSRFILPLVIGFLTGLNLCPPFLLAFTGAADAGGLIDSILYFIAFFFGTSVFFLPAPLIGSFNLQKPLKTIGKMSAAVASAYYFYIGLINIIGSISANSL